MGIKKRHLSTLLGDQDMGMRGQEPEFGKRLMLGTLLLAAGSRSENFQRHYNSGMDVETSDTRHFV